MRIGKRKEVIAMMTDTSGAVEKIRKAFGLLTIPFIEMLILDFKYILYSA
jgi:hypothetical protein